MICRWRVPPPLPSTLQGRIHISCTVHWDVCTIARRSFPKPLYQSSYYSFSVLTYGPPLSYFALLFFGPPLVLLCAVSVMRYGAHIRAIDARPLSKCHGMHRDVSCTGCSGVCAASRGIHRKLEPIIFGGSNSSGTTRDYSLGPGYYLILLSGLCGHRRRCSLHRSAAQEHLGFASDSQRHAACHMAVLATAAPLADCIHSDRLIRSVLRRESGSHHPTPRLCRLSLHQRGARRAIDHGGPVKLALCGHAGRWAGVCGIPRRAPRQSLRRAPRRAQRGGL